MTQASVESKTLTGQLVVSGGTRAKVTWAMINRPWQPPLPSLPAGKKCFGCLEPEGSLQREETEGRIVALYPEGSDLGGYSHVALKNSFTPYDPHLLVLPRRHEPIWPWGATAELSADLIAVYETLVKGIWTSDEMSMQANPPCRFGFHYGQLAGQNAPHPHYHLFQEKGAKPTYQPFCPWCHWPRLGENRILLEDERFVAVVDGVRPGQTRIISREHDHWYWMTDNTSQDEQAKMLMGVANLFQEAFESPVTGLGPEFVLHGTFSTRDHFHLVYTPILNHQGCAEQFALESAGSGLYVLPCSQEELLRYIRLCRDKGVVQAREEYFA